MRRPDTKDGATTLRIGAFYSRTPSEPELSEVEAEATSLLAFLATDAAELRRASPFLSDVDAASPAAGAPPPPEPPRPAGSGVPCAVRVPSATCSSPSSASPAP